MEVTMPDSIPSAISHVSLGTNQYEAAKAFYVRVLEPLGCKFIMEHPGAAAFGKSYPEFWIQVPIDGKPATLGNGAHVGFVADSREQVEAFFTTAVAAGAKPDGPPGGREHYGAPYFGCFVRDLDGNKIEATFWDMELDKQ
jgi:catechol 2,3-dioxygenase-like lactoylglutathione lyase family enzyme